MKIGGRATLANDARFARNGTIMEVSLANPTVAAEPFRWAAQDKSLPKEEIKT